MKMLQIALIMMMFESSLQDNMLKHTGKNFEIYYPASWHKQEQANVVYFLSPKENEKDMFLENVNLVLQDLSQQPMNLEHYTELSIKQIKENFGDSVIVSMKVTTLAGQEAKELVYNMNYQGRKLKLKQYWFIKGNTAYLFTYTAESSQYDKYEKTATEIIRSFTFTK